MAKIHIRKPDNTPPEMKIWVKQVTNLLNNICNVQDDSTASNVAEIVSDFNDLLQHFRDADTGETT